MDNAGMASDEGTKKETLGGADWFCLLDGAKKGPYAENQVIDLLKSGSITGESLVWRSGFEDWKKLADTELHMQLKDVVPPVPPSAISDKWLWCLATVPLFISWIVEAAFPESGKAGMIVCIVLNCIFLCLDVELLKKGGRQAESWLWLGLLIVPLYLGVRASRTNKNWLPLVAWIVLMVFDLNQ